MAADPECLFCRIVARELPAQIVAEDALTVAFMDIAPASPGHLLVVPRRHAPNVLEVEPEDLDATIQTARRMAQRVVERLDADGVTLMNSCGAAAWQTVFHLHVHVIPRRSGDGVTLPGSMGHRGDADEIADLAQRLRDG